MTKTILVCGHGPGISDAVARQFGAQGFAVALIARSADKLTAAADALALRGITAKAFPADLGDPAAVTDVVARVRDQLGPITVVHWNAYATGAGDLTAASPAELRTSLDVGVIGLVAAVQAALPDLQAQQGAVLVTGGGLSFYDDKVDSLAVSWGAMGLAVVKAAQHKLVGVLGARLAKDNIYVGEVVVLGSVKGTAFDAGNATIEPARVATRFWELYEARTPRVTQVG
jgi:NADP-dependent 3-hydroxy acid dehydrogenase YdfG